jgi:hypothetical protein
MDVRMAMLVMLFMKIPFDFIADISLLQGARRPVREVNLSPSRLCVSTHMQA